MQNKNVSIEQVIFRKAVNNLSLPGMAPSAWVKELLELTQDVSTPINIRASKAIQMLKSMGLAYAQKLLPEEVLIHPDNRGGQMCNCWDVWAKGEQICSVGWDKNKIREPVAFELPVDVTKRADMVAANANLAAQSDHKLAKPFGKERFASVSASHTTAFLRALQAGCSNGSNAEDLSLKNLLSREDDLNELMTKGFEWTVISAKVEEEVGILPSLLQQAFNSDLLMNIFGNSKVFETFVCVCSGDMSIGKPPTELEVMMTIAQAYEKQPANQKDLTKAIAIAASSMPPCKSYIQAIGEFVGSFAGGESFELLKYLDVIGA